MTNQQLLESLISELKHVPVTDNTEWFKGYSAGHDDARTKIQLALDKLNIEKWNGN